MRLVRVTHRNEDSCRSGGESADICLENTASVNSNFLIHSLSLCLSSFSDAITLSVIHRTQRMNRAPLNQRGGETQGVVPQQIKLPIRMQSWIVGLQLSHIAKLHPQCLSSEGQCCCYSPQKPFSQIGLQLEAYRKFSCFMCILAHLRLSCVCECFKR